MLTGKKSVEGTDSYWSKHTFWQTLMPNKKEIKGKEVDKLVGDAQKYLNRIQVCLLPI